MAKLSQLVNSAKSGAFTFHHHMGTAVETEEEISKNIIGLLLDIGHLYFAEGNYKNLISVWQEN